MRTERLCVGPAIVRDSADGFLPHLHSRELHESIVCIEYVAHRLGVFARHVLTGGERPLAVRDRRTGRLMHYRV